MVFWFVIAAGYLITLGSVWLFLAAAAEVSGQTDHRPPAHIRYRAHRM